ncbi:hypothetical protein GCM10009838_16110 [Catenulispora subtropica]|uniref:Uncharacterized protein n=2 Tax=Catenulispora subtropica TaxID=450798 RepID=A0ABP5CAC1_9ACTN
MVVIAGIGAAVAVALAGRAAVGTAQRMRAWYRDSLAGSAIELVVLAGLVGGLLGELYRRMHS